jgi:hypothetical protein
MRPSVPVAHAVTYFTVSTHRFFPGTVALLNSLRLTGNAGQLVVLDAGLRSNEQELLREQATVFALPKTAETHPVVTKTYAHLSQPSGVVIVIDSDMIVTGSLEHIVALAGEGKICAYPDFAAVRGRWFPEWHETLGLRAPLRPDVYVNTGLVAFSTDHWPHLLERWREVCELIPPGEMWGSRSPFNAPDQDALNALLMSEIPREALALLPERDNVFGGHAVVEDFDTLACTCDGQPTKILHLLDSPKPWESSGWLRLASTDYVRLMRRLLFARDVPLRLDPDLVRPWLRPSWRGELTLGALGATNKLLVRTAYMLPEPFRTRLRQFRRWFAYGRSHRREVRRDRTGGSAVGGLLSALEYTPDPQLLGAVLFAGLLHSFTSPALFGAMLPLWRRKRLHLDSGANRDAS